MTRENLVHSFVFSRASLSLISYGTLLLIKNEAMIFTIQVK